MAFTADAPPADPIYALASVQPAVHAFWQAYVEISAPDAGQAAAFLRYCTAFAGTRRI